MVDGFTHLIPELHRRHDVKLIMFKCERRKHTVEEYWSHLDIPILVYLCPDNGNAGYEDEKFEDLGILCQKVTCAPLVVCVGAGWVTVKEFNGCPQNVDW